MLWSKYKEPQLKYKNWKPAYIVTVHSHCFSLPQKKWTLFLSNIQNMDLIFSMKKTGFSDPKLEIL